MLKHVANGDNRMLNTFANTMPNITSHRLAKSDQHVILTAMMAGPTESKYVGNTENGTQKRRMQGTVSSTQFEAATSSVLITVLDVRPNVYHTAITMTTQNHLKSNGSAPFATHWNTLMAEITFFKLIRDEENDTVRSEVTPVFDDPFAYGMLLVDTIRTLANMCMREDGASSIEPYLERIKEGLDAEWEKKTAEIVFDEKWTEDDDPAT